MSDDLGFHHRMIQADSRDTILLLHGTGGTEDDLIPLAERVAPGIRLLSPRGKILEDGMPRYFRRKAPGVFDEDDLILRTHELADFVEKAIDTYDLDSDRIVALGYSNGANIAASMLLLRPEVLRAAALLHAMVPLRLDRLPQLPATPVLLTAGRRDPIVLVEETEELAALFRQAGAALKLHWGVGGHQVDPPELAEVTRWLADDAQVC